MAKVDKIYHNLLEEILSNGFKYEDPNRKGVHRLQISSYTFKHDFSDGFPAITTKSLYWKGVVGELLWFMRGDTNIKYLLDNKIPIWNKDAYNHFKRQSYPQSSGLNEFDIKDFILAIQNGHYKEYNLGDLGKVYGYQFRKFAGTFDQLKWIINTMKNNPMATKKTVTFMNPADKDDQALSPCHTGFKILMEPLSVDERRQIYSSRGHSLNAPIEDSDTYLDTYNIPKHKFTLQWEQDSVDTFLGLPFNVASYALLAEILGVLTNTVPMGIIGDLSNVHIYEPHLDAVKEQLSRDVNKYDGCKLDIKEIGWHESVDDILEYLMISDFKLKEYNSYPRISAEMLAYSK